MNLIFVNSFHALLLMKRIKQAGRPTPKTEAIIGLLISLGTVKLVGLTGKCCDQAHVVASLSADKTTVLPLSKERGKRKEKK